MSRRRSAMLLVVAFTVAAATSGAPAAADNGGDAHTLEDCYVRQGLFPIPYAEAQALMPAGFTAATYLEAYVAPTDPTATFAELDLAYVWCKSASVGGTVVAAPKMLGVGILVADLPAVYAGDADVHFLTLGFIHSSAQLASLHAKWGLPVSEQGTLTREETAVGPLLAAKDEASSTTGTISLSAPVAMTGAGPLAEETLRFLFAKDGAVVGAMDAKVGAHDIHVGEALFDVSGSGWMAGIPTGTKQGPVADGVGDPWGMVMEKVTFEKGFKEIAVDHGDCRIIEVFGSGDKEALAPLVPAGFEVPDAPLLVVAANRCGADGTTVGRGLLAVQVQPTDPKLVSPTAVNYFWEPEHFLVKGTGIQKAFQKVGAAATAASVSVDVGAAGASFSIQAGGTSYAFSGAFAPVDGTGAVVAQVPPPFREYAAGDGGYVYLDGAFSGDGAAMVSAGTLTVSGSSVGTALFGGSSQRVAGVLAAADYESAKVGFVPWP